MSQHWKNSARGKVIDKKWFIRIGCLWGLQESRREGAAPWVLSGLYFYNQRNGGRERRPSLSFLSRHHASIISSSSRLGREVSCPCLVKLGPQIIVFYVCGEHVLRIIKPLSSLDRMLVSYHHCFIFWEHVLWFLCMVLLLSKLAWFCGSADPLSWVIINFRGLPHFFSIYNPLVGLTGLPWWPKW